MSNVEIIIIGMFISTVIMMIWHFIKVFGQRILYKKYCKRTDYVKQLVKEEKIPYEIINVGKDADRVKDAMDNNGLIIDNKLYNNKNALFLKENAKVYIIGKKEDFFIVLTGGYIR